MSASKTDGDKQGALRHDEYAEHSSSVVLGLLQELEKPHPAYETKRLVAMLEREQRADIEERRRKQRDDFARSIRRERKASALRRERSAKKAAAAEGVAFTASVEETAAALAAAPSGTITVEQVASAPTSVLGSTVADATQTTTVAASVKEETYSDVVRALIKALEKAIAMNQPQSVIKHLAAMLKREQKASIAERKRITNAEISARRWKGISNFVERMLGFIERMLDFIYKIIRLSSRFLAQVLHSLLDFILQAADKVRKLPPRALQIVVVLLSGLGLSTPVYSTLRDNFDVGTLIGSGAPVAFDLVLAVALSVALSAAVVFFGKPIFDKFIRGKRSTRKRRTK